jgi:hypothetical protein
MRNRVIYWARNKLYLFDGSTIYFMHTTTAEPDLLGDPYFDALCLIDTLEGFPPPVSLVHNEFLFVIQAASPNPFHKEWTTKRTGVREFILNPPEEAEMIGVYGLFSHFSTDTD